VKAQTEYHHPGEPTHRFLGYYCQEIEGRPMFIYRCVCGYVEADPVSGGPFISLDHRLKPRPDARRLILHLDLERAHELN
jgi:hypothetical protein